MVSSRSKVNGLKALLVSLLCLAGAGGGGYLLFLDYHQSAGEGLGPPMAKIERRESKVRRKPSRSFAWSNAQQDEKLFRRDSVQTSVGSAAAIRFSDGTLLELGENSLVVIDDVQKLSLDFLKGSVVLHTAEGDKRVSVGSDGKAKFEELPIRLVKPEPLARFFATVGEAKSIHFAWKPRSGQDSSLPTNLVVQVSPDRGFRGSRVRSFPLRDLHSLDADVPLKEGAYFWRLAAADMPLTDVGQFRVIDAVPLEPISPGANEQLLAFGDETAAQFHWRASEETSAGHAVHELQVSRDPGFAVITAHQEISATSGHATLRGLPVGALYWRVQSHYGGNPIVSRVEQFSIAKAQRPSLSLTLPEDKKTLERLPSLHFSWRSDGQGLDYALEIKDSKGADAASTKTRATSYLWKNPAPGVYRWRVTASHRDLPVGETSWRSFSVFEGTRVALRAPAKGQELYYWEKAPSFDFEWERDELVVRQPRYSYQVAVSLDPDFKALLLGPKTREESMDHAKLSLDSGQYFWKVLVVDESGQTVKSSDVWRFAYGIYPPLAAPEPLTPARQAVFNVVDKEQNPVASWQEVKGAEAYEVTLYALEPGRATANTPGDGPPPGSRVVFHEISDKPNAEFKSLVPATYFWSVRAIDRIKRKGQAMQLRAFTVTYGDVLSAPKVISPEVQ